MEGSLMEKEVIALVVGSPLLTLFVIKFFLNRFISQMDTRRDKDDVVFTQILTKQNELVTSVAVINTNLAILKDRQRDVDKIKEDINKIGAKFRGMDFK